MKKQMLEDVAKLRKAEEGLERQLAVEFQQAHTELEAQALQNWVSACKKQCGHR